MRGEQPKNYALTQNSATTNTGDPRACGQQKTLTAQANNNASTKHAPVQVHEHTAKCKRMQTPDGCTGLSASQKIAMKEQKRSLLLTLLNYI